MNQPFNSAVNRRVFTRNVAGTVAAACGLANEWLLFGQDETAAPFEVPYKMFRPTSDPVGKLRAARERALRVGRAVQS